MPHIKTPHLFKSYYGFDKPLIDAVKSCILYTQPGDKIRAGLYWKVTDIYKNCKLNCNDDILDHKIIDGNIIYFDGTVVSISERPTHHSYLWLVKCNPKVLEFVKKLGIQNDINLLSIKDDFYINIDYFNNLYYFPVKVFKKI